MEPNLRDVRVTPSGKYRVRYRIEGQRLDRESLMILLERRNTPSGMEYIFSARPLAGTQTLYQRQIVALAAVPANTPLYLNRIVR